MTKENLQIKIPALPRPTLAELQAKYPGIKSIKRDTSPVEPVTLTLATVLRTNESSINGNVYEERLARYHPLLLGYQHRQWLLEHQSEFPAFMALLGQVYVDFLGLVVVDEGGRRFFPYARSDGEQWDEGWDWLGNDFSRNGRVAVSGKSRNLGNESALGHLETRILELEQRVETLERWKKS